MSPTPIIITEVFWHATCSCGWASNAPNTADTMGNKVRNHLMTYHADSPADISITSFVQVRPSTSLP